MIEGDEQNNRRPNLSRRTFLRNAALVAGGASLYLLNGWKTWTTVKKMLPFKTTTSSGNATGYHPRTGDISLGTKVNAVTQTIGTSGGYVAISKAGDPLDGFTIYLPPDTYPGNCSFKVSYAPITSQSFGADINPVSPMISIDNGGGYSDEMMYIRVPVKVPDGYFAMGFIYDEQTKQLEGMPLVAVDGDSITLATCHFCNIFISMIDKLLLHGPFDSGFLPGLDDWQFTNYGSFAAPKGHCDGQSVSAMWYYCTRPDGKDSSLYERYDNNGDQPMTPDFWQDDSLGYRFCSVVQAHGHPTSAFWLALAGKNWVRDAGNNLKFVDTPVVLGDEVTWNLFAYSMQATHEPQLVGVWTEAGTGHEMVCYAIDPGQFCVADPNYPGIPDRAIEYTDGKFQPYNSAENKKLIDAGGGKSYSKIVYLAKTTVFRWDQIAKMWWLVKNRNIGIGVFPSYELYYKDQLGQITPTGSGFSTATKAINIYVYFGATQGDTSLMAEPAVYRDGALLPRGAGGVIDLVQGDNKLGIYITGKVGSEDEYIDFQYINVKYVPSLVASTTAAVAGSNLMALQQMKTFSGNFQGQCSYKEKTGAWFISLPMPYGGLTESFTISWNGTSFGGTNAIPVVGGAETNTLSGSVSSDGKTITSLVWTYSRKSTITTASGISTSDSAIRIELKNIPVSNLVFASGLASTFHFAQSGQEVKNYLTKLEYHISAYLAGVAQNELTYVQDSINWNAPAPNSSALTLDFSK